MEKEKSGVTKASITFTRNQIDSIKLHSDADKLDRLTGKTMVMAKLLLPSKGFRTFRFEKDDNGIDRNDRTAYFNVPTSYIGLNLRYASTKGVVEKEEAKNIMLGLDNRLIDKRDDQDVTEKYVLRNCYMYNPEDKVINVYFKGKALDVRDNGDGTVNKTYDNPQQAVIAWKDICDMYKESVEKSKDMREKTKDKIANKTKSKTKAKTASKGKTTKVKSTKKRTKQEQSR